MQCIHIMLKIDMYCPSCQTPNTKVIDSRHLSDGLAVRRRRACLNCDFRYTTYEKLQLQVPALVKNDKRREPYNREKISKGINKACQKRPLTTAQINRLIDDVEMTLSQMNNIEVPAKIVGEVVMEKLYELDPVAYVRYASFYWNFKDIDGFIESLQKSIGQFGNLKEKFLLNKDSTSEKPSIQQ
ncbi:transcriptional regulator NrdR [Halobacteriovorax sp. XZX-3]|uniref:transcriptional regulator NrdR n=1 Tax=Halobacteriovorax sp. RT-1-6 TaxID=3391170 RepID=UPI00372B5862